MKKLEEFRVNVLGAEYVAQIGARKELDIQPEHSGECQYFRKRILVCNEFSEEIKKEDRPLVLKSIIRHEVAHAFLYESGREENANDEDLVTWLEIMSNKLVELQNLVADLALDKFKPI